MPPLAGIDGRRFVDCGYVAPVENALGDEIDEAQDRDLAAMRSGGDAHESIGDHRRDDLQADGIFIVAEEFADPQMLLEPAEKQLDLPAYLQPTQAPQAWR